MRVCCYRTTLFGKNATAAAAFCEKLAVVSSTADPDYSLPDRLSGLEEGVNTFFLTVMGALVFVMHAGFAMVSQPIT